MTPSAVVPEFDGEFQLTRQLLGGIHREVVNRFPRYGRSVASLPAAERVKIDRIARFVAHSLRSGRQPFRTIRLVGHSDLDTPRRPAFENQIALARAQDLLLALWRALDRVDRGSGRAAPPYSSRVAWEVHSAGATQLVVPNPRTESDRLRNRRVEIQLIPHRGSVTPVVSRGRPGFRFASSAAAKAGAGAAIDDFLRRAPNDLIRYNDALLGPDQPDRRICVKAAATKAMQLCSTATASDRDVPCNPPLTLQRGRCHAITRGITILDGKDHRPPITTPIGCCGVDTPCLPSKLSKLPPGDYLVLKYKPQPLAQMVGMLKCLLDRGCVVPVGVLSGICDDKPDLSGICQPIPLRDKWRDCWEHWLLVIGYDGDRFVFWDSSQASVMGPIKRDKDNHWFGFLYYDSTNDRLSTATTNPGVRNALEVEWNGFHTQGFPRVYAQKRYQVVSMWTGLPWKPDGGLCPNDRG
jgi:hypothetical protein